MGNLKKLLSKILVIMFLVTTVFPYGGLSIALGATNASKPPQDPEQYASWKKSLYNAANVNSGVATLTSSIGSISNDFIEYVVANGGDGSGRFTIGTTGGNPDNTNDDNQKMLYGHPNPGTSFTAIKVDGTDNYFTAQSVTPDSANLSTKAIEEINGINVEQELSIVTNSNTGKADTVQIKYIAKNQDSVVHTVGTRIMMDTMLGSNDAAPFRIPGYGDVTTELELTGDRVPDYWMAFDSLTNPSVIGQGTLLRTDNKPDKVQFTNWYRASETMWDLTVNPGSPNGDSAVSVFWNPTQLQPGESKTYVTYYGLSDFIQNLTPPIGVTLNRVSSIDATTNGYNPNPIKISGFVNNLSSVAAQNVKVKINLNNGLSVVNGTNEITIGSLGINETKDFYWDVMLPNFSADTTLTYSVEATADNTESKVLTNTFTVPASKVVVEPPTISGLTDALTIPLGESKSQTGTITSSGKNIEKVSLCVEGWYDDADKIGLYKSETPNSTSFDLSKFTINTTDAPFNKEGTYTVNIWAKLEGIDAQKVGSFTVVVEPGIPPVITGFTGPIEITQGEKKAVLPGTITSNTPLTTVTIGIAGKQDVLSTKSFVAADNISSFNMSEFVIDTTTGVLATPGTYEITLWAKSVGCPDPQSELGRITLVVKEAQKELLSLESNKSQLTVEKGKSIDLLSNITITGKYSDGTSEDLTNQARYSSSMSDTNIATVVGGNITGVNEGTTTLTCSYSGKSVEITIVVTTSEKQLICLTSSPTQLTIEKGKSIDFVSNINIKGHYTDGTSEDLTYQAGYNSFMSDTSIATVGGGNITGVNEGTTTLTCSYNGKSVGISLVVTPTQKQLFSLISNSTKITVQKGTRINFLNRIKIMGKYSDGTSEDLTYEAGINSTISNTKIATVDAGYITGNNKGTTDLNCQYNGISVSIKVVVDDSTISAVPNMPSGLIATTVSNNEINLTWLEVLGAIEYNVYLNVGGKWSKLATTTSTSYNHTSLQDNTTYYYKVTAVNSIGEGDGGLVTGKTKEPSDLKSWDVRYNPDTQEIEAEVVTKSGQISNHNFYMVVYDEYTPLYGAKGNEAVYDDWTKVDWYGESGLYANKYFTSWYAFSNDTRKKLYLSHGKTYRIGIREVGYENELAGILKEITLPKDLSKNRLVITPTYYSMYDSQWDDYQYYPRNLGMPVAGRKISKNGCGPTAMAMVISTLSNSSVTPDIIAEYSMTNGFINANYDTTFGLFEGSNSAAEHYGLDVTSTTNIDTVAESLADGKHVAIASMGPGHFTSGGHLITLMNLTDYKGQEMFTVYDPNSNNGNYKNSNEIITTDSTGIVLASKQIIDAEKITFFIFSKNAEKFDAYSITVSNDLVEFVAGYESYRKYKYVGLDKQNYTIGYGHVILPGENFDNGIDNETAMALLNEALNGDCSNSVRNFMLKNNLKLTQSQFDALVDFTYNMGVYCWTPEKSQTLMNVILNQDSTEKQIIDAFCLYIKVDSNGVKVNSAGLWQRRMDDAEMYNNQDYNIDTLLGPAYLNLV